jgi:hypothetical protein
MLSVVKQKQVDLNGIEEDNIACFATDVKKLKRRRLTNMPKCLPYSPSDVKWCALLDTALGFSRKRSF